MQKTISIRSILEKEMEQRNFNISQFSKFSGINRGTLSQAINGNPPKLPSISELDQIALISGYTRKELYRLYIEECFADKTPHWKRLKNFLYRCIELNWTIMIEEVMSRLLEDTSQSQIIFETVESWYEEGHREILIPFYNYVTASEKYRNSGRLAISQYRIFRLSQNENFESNLHAAITFEPYRNELPIGYRLDGLLKLANIYFNQHMWKKVEQFADELRELATSAYENNLHIRINLDQEKGLETERHLVVYYGHGYLLKGNALEKQNKYEEAMSYISKYKDLSWFKGLDDVGKLEVLKFKNFAQANNLNLHILMGNTKKLDAYVKFLQLHPMEILPGLLTILESANKYRFFIDHILDLLSDKIEEFQRKKLSSDSHYSTIFDLDHYTDLCIELGVYYFRKIDYNMGIDYILESLRVSKIIRKNKNIITAMALLHSLRSKVNLTQFQEYDALMKEVLTSEDIKLSFLFDDNS